jgi:phosphoribosylformylglycinamidine synthase
MSAASHPGEGAGIYEAVKSIGLELCPALGITIPVGKDSMSMKTKWKNGSNEVSLLHQCPLLLPLLLLLLTLDLR